MGPENIPGRLQGTLGTFALPLVLLLPLGKQVSERAHPRWVSAEGRTVGWSHRPSSTHPGTSRLYDRVKRALRAVESGLCFLFQSHYLVSEL